MIFEIAGKVAAGYSCRRTGLRLLLKSMYAERGLFIAGAFSSLIYFLVFFFVVATVAVVAGVVFALAVIWPVGAAVCATGRDSVTLFEFYEEIILFYAPILPFFSSKISASSLKNFEASNAASLNFLVASSDI